ncbi:MAG TPA: ATP-binding protein [Casimicrobiaceae bacterium]|nr:ATP-binding protein [Casimicrobiaceae bacterium]
MASGRAEADAFIDILPWPAFIVTETGRVTRVNVAMETAGGRLPPRGDRQMRSLFPDYFAALDAASPWRVPREVEVTRATPCGPVHEMLWLRPLGARRLVIVTDRTRRWELESSQAQNARLASLGFLLASVSHEINNPLATINSIVQILQSKRGASRDVRDKGIAEIAQSTNRLLLLTRKLTGFARVDDAMPVRFAVDTVIDEASLQLKYDSLGETVALTHQRDDSAFVMGHPAQIQQVFFNLFLNAAQVMKGSGTIGVTTSALTGSTVTVTVADTGPGIVPAHLDEIFEPFFTTKGGGGLGLGLVISNEIVHEHGGTIAAANKPDGGALFQVTLPLARERKRG